MRILAILLCLVAFNLNGQEEEFKQMLSIRQVTVTDMESIYSGVLSEKIETTKSDAISRFLSPSETDSQLEKKSLISETFAVSVQYLSGYLFHVADYFDGTRVVTCLDGPLVGLQGISINGVQIAESYDVTWLSNYFVHYYAVKLVDHH